MAISNKDKYIWDWWNPLVLVDPTSLHECNSWETAKEYASDPGDFVLSSSAFKSQLIKELYGR